MDRLTRGFHRLGLAVSLPLLVLAAISFVIPVLVTTVDGGASSHFIGFASLVTAAIWYAAARTIAWIINGFRETA